MGYTCKGHEGPLLNCVRCTPANPSCHPQRLCPAPHCLEGNGGGPGLLALPVDPWGGPAVSGTAVQANLYLIFSPTDGGSEYLQEKRFLSGRYAPPVLGPQPAP